MTIYQFNADQIDGNRKALADYKGDVLLIVNTATKCVFTPQLTGLQVLYDEYKERGFTVLGFPCNQFANQEPGDNAEIAEVCSINYGVQFPMFEKVEVKGEGAHPLFKYLTSEKKGILSEQIKWNFTKFLINRDGEVVKRYAPTTKPEKIAKDIEGLL